MSESLLIQHCAPTLAGIKVGNLINYKYQCFERLRRQIERWNKKMNAKGVHMIILLQRDTHVLIYVYRPEVLKQELEAKEVQAFLKCFGYRTNEMVGCLEQLKKRLKDDKNFPHEIGIFLGYPLHDIKGFIQLGAKACLCSGVWKVYDQVEEAKEKFANYKACTKYFQKCFEKEGDVLKLIATL